MAETERSKAEKYAYLDELSTEKLEELLRTDAETMDGRDNGAIFYILEVIEKREKEHPTGRLPDVDKAWGEFNKHYNTPEGEGLSLYPGRSGDNPQVISPKPERFMRGRPRRTVVRHFVIATVLILIITMSTVPAFGYASIFQMIGQWTAEQFGFVGTPESSNNSIAPDNQTEGTYASLQDALDQYGITEAVVPHSIPDGFQLEEIWVQEYAERGDVEIISPYSKDEKKALNMPAKN